MGWAQQTAQGWIPPEEGTQCWGQTPKQGTENLAQGRGEVGRAEGAQDGV